MTVKCKDIEPVIGCWNKADGTKQSVVIHFTYGLNANGVEIIAAIRYTDAQGVVIAVPATDSVTVGECPLVGNTQPLRAGGLNIASGSFAATHDPDGNGNTWSPSTGLQSFTVSATNSGVPSSGSAVIVEFVASGIRLYMVDGETRTWSVAQDSGSVSEILDNQIIVTCNGNSSASIGWTQQ